jgi:NTP pyrophosphatase (non-canonical NTP hydrolase)
VCSGEFSAELGSGGLGAWFSCYMWPVSIARLQGQLRAFAAERDWEPFHTPKNLVMALAGEVGELTEIFQWLTPAESAAVMSDETRAGQVRDELADVFAYLLSVADALEVDLERALADKMVKNAAKYPVQAARGRAAKYTDLAQPVPEQK